MKKLIWLIAAALVIVPCAVRAQAPGSTYYVSAAGNNDNDGLTEATAFKTLGYAVWEAASGSSDIKTVTVIGTLNQASEGGNNDTVFTPLIFTSTEILITGVPNAAGARRAVLSAAGTQKYGVNITMARIRFEHIEISGSPKTGLEVYPGAEVTLGEGAAVRNNSGGGVSISDIEEGLRDSFKPGRLILDGGTVEGNRRAAGNGAGIFVAGAFTMKRGAIRNNTVTGTNYGGGGYS